MPWSEVAPGSFQRAIGEKELFIKLIGDPGHNIGREHWAINSFASFTLAGSLVKEDLPSLFLKAWKIFRFNHPDTAVQTVDDQVLIYTVPDLALLNQWAVETFLVVENKTADDFIPDHKPNSYINLTYFPKSNEILCHAPYWRTDGVGMLHFFDAFFDLVARPALPEPQTLYWGQETDRLATSIEEVANLPVAPTDAIKSMNQKCIDAFYQAAGAVGIPHQGELTIRPSGTRSSRYLFGQAETEIIFRHCNAIGISATAAVYASIAATNCTLVSLEKKNRHHTSTFRSNLRPYLLENRTPYVVPLHQNLTTFTPANPSGNYTIGWMKNVPPSASWIEHAIDYREEYSKGLSKDSINSHRSYALCLCTLIGNAPQHQELPSDVNISSIGIAERYIKRVKGTQDRGVQIQSVSMGAEILTRQCVCFVWTFRDRLNLNLVYNESFHDERDTALFLQTLKEIMLKELGV